MLYDVDSIRNRLIQRLKSKTSFADFLEFSVNLRLIDSISEEIAELARYDDYNLTECKWDLAQNKSSLVAESKIRDYEPYRKKGAKGVVRFGVVPTFDAPPTKNVVIPKYTAMGSSTNSDIKVCTVSSEVLTTIDDYVDLNVIEGVPKSLTFYAVGLDFEEIEIDNEFIANDTYEVYVNDILWTEYDNIREAEDGTILAYEIENKLNLEGIYIKFGNNVNGKKLTIGDEIVFRFVETNGIAGNILAQNIIDTVDDTIYNIDTEKVTVYCSNLDRIDGGDDEESVESIRLNAPKTFQAGNRAVNIDDYIIFLKQSPYVKNATVWGEYEYNLDNGNPPGTYVPLEENVVHVAAFTPAGEQLTQLQKEEIIAYLSNYKSPTDIVQFEDVYFINLKFNVSAKVKDKSNVLSEVSNDIETALIDRYELDSMTFKEDIRNTVYDCLIQSVTGINYHNTYVEIFNEGVFSLAYQYNDVLQILGVKTNTIKVYVRDNSLPSPVFELIGTDNGVGSIVGEVGYNLIGSTINYSTGEFFLIVNSGISGAYTNFDIKVYYQNDDANQDIVLNKRNQIARYRESDIGVAYID